MEYISKEKNIKLTDTVVCLGNFDGLHLGHQNLINMAKDVSIKNSLKTVVFSFFPHPRKVLTGKDVDYILTSNEKKMCLNKLGADYYIEYPFDTDFANLSPKEFISTILVNKLGCKVLVVGNGFNFGKNRSGNVAILKELCVEFDIHLIDVPHISYQDDKISSSTIREYIILDDLEKVNIFMGRPYFINGIVQVGKKNGRKIGFPTVNLLPPSEKLLPSNGIYITKTIYNGECYLSATNIGKNPTFGDNKKTIETYILDFNKDIYGEEITVMFYKKIRDEIKFENLEELKHKIAEDIDITKKYFHEYSF